MYERQNTIYYSNWTMDKISYFYEHKHLTEEPKFNIETNSADLFLYYTAVIVPTILLKFFKRWLYLLVKRLVLDSYVCVYFCC